MALSKKDKETICQMYRAIVSASFVAAARDDAMIEIFKRQQEDMEKCIDVWIEKSEGRDDFELRESQRPNPTDQAGISAPCPFHAKETDGVHRVVVSRCFNPWRNQWAQQSKSKKSISPGGEHVVAKRE